MICGLEALVKMEAIKVEREERLKREAEERERERKEYTIDYCEKILNSKIEEMIRMGANTTSPIVMYGGRSTTCLSPMKETREAYADGRSSYEYEGYCFNGTRYGNLCLDKSILEEYLKSYCWKINLKPFSGYKKCVGEITLYELTISPIPKCM
jgi:hypothetical protein